MNNYETAEIILKKWLNITSVIQNDRIVTALTFNEALVCNHLMYQKDSEPDYMTPSELCKKTGIQKSLMNRVLKSLTEKNLIEYVTDVSDKRSTPVRINVNNQDVFINEHKKNIKIVSDLIDYWGDEKTAEIVKALGYIEDGAKNIILKEKPKK